MARRTPEEELEHQMQKMKDAGVKIIVTQPGPWASAIAAAAKTAGIYEEKSN
jgi:predicted peroxiredoxin